MKILLYSFAASLCLGVLAYGVEPEFNAVEGWLQPSSQMETIGPAHGDVAVSSTGEVYVSILSGPRAGIQVYGADGKYLRNVPDAPNDFHGFVIHRGSDGEFIYGARVGGQSILKMQLDGKVVLTIEGSSIPESFVNKQKDGKPGLRLTAVDVAPDGRIFAVDGYSSDYIHSFDTQGKYLKSFGGKVGSVRLQDEPQDCHRHTI